jgi:hypothetical protein
MPLDDAGLDEALTALLSGEKSASEAKNALKKAITDYVKSATVSGSVTITNALLAPPGGGPVTGTSTGSMSNGSLS